MWSSLHKTLWHPVSKLERCSISNATVDSDVGSWAGLSERFGELGLCANLGCPGGHSQMLSDVAGSCSTPHSCNVPSGHSQQLGEYEEQLATWQHWVTTCHDDSPQSVHSHAKLQDGLSKQGLLSLTCLPRSGRFGLLGKEGKEQVHRSSTSLIFGEMCNGSCNLWTTCGPPLSELPEEMLSKLACVWIPVSSGAFQIDWIFSTQQQEIMGDEALP